jgi:hypothetical protein
MFVTDISRWEEYGKAMVNSSKTLNPAQA